MDRTRGASKGDADTDAGTSVAASADLDGDRESVATGMSGSGVDDGHEAADGADDAPKPHKLVVTTQPPDQWYNQARGRQDTITVKARLVGPDHPALYHMDRLPLTLTLLYENYVEVAQQNILQAMATPELDCSTREVTVIVRINQVSRSHQKQRFRVRLALAELPEGCPSISVISATTTPVRVLSKLSTRNRARAAAAKKQSLAAIAQAVPQLIRQKARPGTVDLTEFPLDGGRVDFAKMDKSQLLAWAQRASQVMRALEWWAVGYETVVNQHGDIIIDRTRPIMQCHVCGAVHCGDESGSATHEPGCGLEALTHGMFGNEPNSSLQRFPRLGRSGTVQPPHPAARAFPPGTAAAGPFADAHNGPPMYRSDTIETFALSRSDTVMTLDSQGAPMLVRGNSAAPNLSPRGPATAPLNHPGLGQQPHPSSLFPPVPASELGLGGASANHRRSASIGRLSQFSDIVASQESIPGTQPLTDQSGSSSDGSPSARGKDTSAGAGSGAGAGSSPARRGSTGRAKRKRETPTGGKGGKGGKGSSAAANSSGGKRTRGSVTSQGRTKRSR